MVNGVLIGETFLPPLRAAGGALSDAGFDVGRAFEALLPHELDAGLPADIRRKPTDVAAERRPRQYGNAAIVLGLLQMAGPAFVQATYTAGSRAMSVPCTYGSGVYPVLRGHCPPAETRRQI